MNIRVLYFAVVRERVRRSEEDIQLAEGATVGQLLDELARRYPVVGALRRHVQVARNRQIARDDEVLGDGDEVALIPPVSGGADAVELRETPLVLQEVIDQVAHAGAGALVTFTGLVRGESRGRRVAHLEYEAYGTMALARLQAIVAEIERTHAGCRIAIHHRVGHLQVGELAVVIAASAPHRAEAFAACRVAIERLKQEVPIWKKEVGEGGEEWIGRGP